jgi:hypothetical protein
MTDERRVVVPAAAEVRSPARRRRSWFKAVEFQVLENGSVSTDPTHACCSRHGAIRGDRLLSAPHSFEFLKLYLKLVFGLFFSCGGL